jgi:hypothetical protein
MAETVGYEDRVAALEGFVRQIAAGLGIDADAPSTEPLPMTDEQEAEWRRLFDEAMQARPFTYTVLPPAPALAPDEVRQLLRECVTVVKPGEVLVLRCPENCSPEQAETMQEHAAYWLADNAPGIRVMVVPHLDMAVMEGSDDH